MTQYEEEPIIDDKEETDTLAYKIGDLENYYADMVLNDDLKEMYAQVQYNLSDFRNNVFFKNIDILEGGLGKLGEKYDPKDPKGLKKKKTQQEKEKLFEQKLKEIKTPEQLMKEFSEKEFPIDI
jgi:hypothetical protein